MEKSKYKVKYGSSKCKKKKKESKQYTLLKNNGKKYPHIFESLLKNVQIWGMFLSRSFWLLLVSRFLSLHGAEKVGRNITV